MLVVTRLRPPADAAGAASAADAAGVAAATDLAAGLHRALEILGACAGYVGGEVGRNVDDPGLWVLSTRWRNVGSYRRALSSYEAKMFVQPLMVHALDEPSAYEVVEPGGTPNESVPRVNG